MVYANPMKPIPTSSAAQPRLSSMILDPFVRAAFDRAERDDGHAICVSNERPRTFGGGAAEHRPDRKFDTLTSLKQNRIAIEYAC
jgi:hypothetical protein